MITKIGEQYYREGMEKRAVWGLGSFAKKMFGGLRDAGRVFKAGKGSFGERLGTARDVFSNRARSAWNYKAGKNFGMVKEKPVNWFRTTENGQVKSLDTAYSQARAAANVENFGKTKEFSELMKQRSAAYQKPVAPEKPAISEKTVAPEKPATSQAGATTVEAGKTPTPGLKAHAILGGTLLGTGLIGGYMMGSPSSTEKPYVAPYPSMNKNIQYPGMYY